MTLAQRFLYAFVPDKLRIIDSGAGLQVYISEISIGSRPGEIHCDPVVLPAVRRVKKIMREQRTQGVILIDTTCTKSAYIVQIRIKVAIGIVLKHVLNVSDRFVDIVVDVAAAA